MMNRFGAIGRGEGKRTDPHWLQADRRSPGRDHFRTRAGVVRSLGLRQAAATSALRYLVGDVVPAGKSRGPSELCKVDEGLKPAECDLG